MFILVLYIESGHTFSIIDDEYKMTLIFLPMFVGGVFTMWAKRRNLDKFHQLFRTLNHLPGAFNLKNTARDLLIMPK